MFLHSVFKSTEDSQKHCISLHDEVCLKKMVLHHGGSLFEKSKDDQASLTRTILGIMTVCTCDGSKFLSEILPISKLNLSPLITRSENDSVNKNRRKYSEGNCM